MNKGRLAVFAALGIGLSAPAGAQVGATGEIGYGQLGGHSGITTAITGTVAGRWIELSAMPLELLFRLDDNTRFRGETGANGVFGCRDAWTDVFVHSIRCSRRVRAFRGAEVNLLIPLPAAWTLALGTGARQPYAAGANELVTWYGSFGVRPARAGRRRVPYARATLGAEYTQVAVGMSLQFR